MPYIGIKQASIVWHNLSLVPYCDYTLTMENGMKSIFNNKQYLYDLAAKSFIKGEMTEAQYKETMKIMSTW